jgi:subtilisin family serine protease
MQLTPRRIMVGLTCAAVVIGMTGVSTWALADDSTPVHLIVGYKTGASVESTNSVMSAKGARRTASGTRRQSLGKVNAQTVEVPKSRSAALIASLKSDPNVRYVEVDRVRKAAEVTPNDPVYAAHLQPELREVNLPRAWETTTGSAVKVAVVDTGVTVRDDLTGAVDAGYNFVSNNTLTSDDVGHGTAVASLIAARGNNNLGMAGVCWSCRILPVKVLDRNGEGLDSTIASGIIWAAGHGAKIINLSLGGPGSSQVLQDAVFMATTAGVLVVAAAGNDGSGVRSYPAAYPDVLSVGATQRCPNFDNDPTCLDGTTTRASWSNHNNGTDQWVDVAAPGVVTAMNTNGTYNTAAAGTSFATPIVSGIGALIASAKPTFTGWSIQNAIVHSGQNIGSWVTYGKVNANLAFSKGTDTVLPYASGMSPAANAKVRGTITVKPLNVADTWSGLRVVGLYVNGTFAGNSKVSPWSVNWNSAGRNGPVNLELRVYDKANNLLTLKQTVIADNTAPTVQVTSAPADGAKISGTVSVGYTGSDTYGIARYELLVNGVVRQTHTATSPAFTFISTGYPATNIKVQVRAYDVAGNSAVTPTRTYHR